MPLIDLQTNLKDLKYGHDEYKGGNSNQPFISAKIPATNEPLPTSFDASADVKGNAVAIGVGSLITAAAGGALIGGLIGGGAGAAVGAGVLTTLTVLGTSELGSGAINFGDSSITVKVPRAGTGGKDFLLRGGTLLPGRVADDIERISKYLTTTPSGLLFGVKQNILSRTGVRPVFTSTILNEGLYSPLNTVIQVGGNALGVHINKQRNPFSGLELTDTNSFINKTPGLYADEAPFLRPVEANNILSVRPGEQGNLAFTTGVGDEENIEGSRPYISSNSPANNILSNRLVGLFGTKLLTSPLYANRKNEIVRFANFGDEYYKRVYAKLTNISPNPYELLRYPGGPGSILGIGDTAIKVATTNENAIFFTNEAVSPNTLNSNVISNLGSVNQVVREIHYSELNTDETLIDMMNPKIVDFRRSLIDSALGERSSTKRSRAPLYSEYNIENRTNLGDPGNVDNRNIISYTHGFNNNSSSFGAASPNSYDKITAYPIYITPKSSATQTAENIDDLVQFRIGVINNDDPTQTEYIHFRAFLNNISDQYSSDWDSVKYIGRGEKLYTYAGFDRKISLSWTVAAQSKVELIPMYKKLNFLASICAPDYSPVGYLRGNIVKLTIGGYLYEQPGIITGFSYEMNDDNASWEIGIDDAGETDKTVSEVPHLIKVTGFNFIPIHTFAPQKQKNSYTKEGYINKYGEQQFIALNNSDNNNQYVDITEDGEPTVSSQQDQALYNLYGLPISPEPEPEEPEEQDIDPVTDEANGIGSMHQNDRVLD